MHGHKDERECGRIRRQTVKDFQECQSPFSSGFSLIFVMGLYGPKRWTIRSWRHPARTCDAVEGFQLDMMENTDVGALGRESSSPCCLKNFLAVAGRSVMKLQWGGLHGTVPKKGRHHFITDRWQHREKREREGRSAWKVGRKKKRRHHTASKCLGERECEREKNIIREELLKRSMRTWWQHSEFQRGLYDKMAGAGVSLSLSLT
jgi:hypothetical protein